MKGESEDRASYEAKVAQRIGGLQPVFVSNPVFVDLDEIARCPFRFGRPLKGYCGIADKKSDEFLTGWEIREYLTKGHKLICPVEGTKRAPEECPLRWQDITVVGRRG